MVPFFFKPYIVLYYITLKTFLSWCCAVFGFLLGSYCVVPRNIRGTIIFLKLFSSQCYAVSRAKCEFDVVQSLITYHLQNSSPLKLFMSRCCTVFGFFEAYVVPPKCSALLVLVHSSKATVTLTLSIPHCLQGSHCCVPHFFTQKAKCSVHFFQSWFSVWRHIFVEKLCAYNL